MCVYVQDGGSRVGEGFVCAKKNGFNEGQVDFFK